MGATDYTEHTERREPRITRNTRIKKGIFGFRVVEILTPPRWLWRLQPRVAAVLRSLIRMDDRAVRASQRTAISTASGTNSR